ncbi:MAG: NAD(+) diphosphatase [Magnetovibrio sp.]|nr:NAD(+) diphosphatase [Magnetovibrio sp.]MBH90283.1 NAD(+) diphosphatase [Magnetovibrio sp.]|tara:strand:+ start:3025 stop:3966 length:942 start_codon:yes stop_codon:yes gene_type:complete
MLDLLYYSKTDLFRPPGYLTDDSWFNARLLNRNTRIVPVWKNQNLVLDHNNPTAVIFTGNHAHALLEISNEIVFLGLDSINISDDNNSAYFAIDLSKCPLPSLAAFMGQAKFIELRQVGMLMDKREGSLLALARGLMFWHYNNRFCSNCGSSSVSVQGGRLRLCTNHDCGREHYPRMDPAVIMLVTRPGPDGGACLMGRGHNFRKGMYSSLAGFVDQGESLEQAVAREVYEETGISVDNIKYRASQPWPFPSSLMLGFRARATTTKINIDTNELEDARWFPKSVVKNAESSGLQLPRRDSIAFWLINDWLNDN